MSGGHADFQRKKDTKGESVLQNIDWIFFDMGSTLIDESKAAERRLRDAARLAGISYEQCFQKTADYFACGKSGYAELAKELHIPLPAWHSEEERLYPDAEGCLKRLSKRHKVGIIANQKKGSRERLAKFGILRYFSVIAASAEEGFAKPDIRLFESALKQADCSPNCAVMIGDRLDNDMAPAKAFGMKTVWIKRGFCARAIIRSEAERPDYIIESLQAVALELGC
ncbi:MAG: HAD family hydrolase [Treponema sp.]